MHVVVHPAQDALGHRFQGIAPHVGVPVDFLNPLQVNGGHHADEQIHVLGHVHRTVFESAVEAFVKQHVRFRRQGRPRGEGADFLAPGRRIHLVVDVVAEFPRALFPVFPEQLF